MLNNNCQATSSINRVRRLCFVQKHSNAFEKGRHSRGKMSAQSTCYILFTLMIIRADGRESDEALK
jgi:hypothetical protein